MDADPFAPLLRPVLQDNGFSGMKSAWTMKVVGDRIKYKSELPPLDQEVCNAVHVISSLRWPGSHTIYTVWIYSFLGRCLDGHLHRIWTKGD